MPSKRLLKKLILGLVSAGLLFTAYKQGSLTAPKSFISTQPGYYKVAKFYDGDTIAVDMNGAIEKVRFIGVDTPETHDPRKPVQCFGEAAANFTKSLIGSSPVRLEADQINTNRDRYNRLLRYVYLPDGRLVDLEIIKAGYGFAYIGFPFTKVDEFTAAEKQARQQAKGLWSACHPEVDDKGFIHSNSVGQ